MFTLVTSCFRIVTQKTAKDLIQIIHIMNHEFNAQEPPTNSFPIKKKKNAFWCQGTGRTRQHLGCWPPPRSSDVRILSIRHVHLHVSGGKIACFIRKIACLDPLLPRSLATLFWSISVSPRPIVSRTTKDPLSASYLHPSHSKVCPPKRFHLPTVDSSFFAGKKNIQFSAVCGAS